MAISCYSLWNDDAIKKTWQRRNEYQIVESLAYFFPKITELADENYLPSDRDMLYIRTRSSGIATERYLIEKTIFEMYDVGGQRNERRKWINCFEGVTAIIFVVALSEFDQVLFEDSQTNRMVC